MAKEIKETVVLILESSGGCDIRIVRWNDGAPMLEKRSYYEDSEGNRKNGKAKGFNAKDVEMIASRMEEIRKIMEGGK